jgi:membrane associated rhomboid family serine protease
MFLPLRSKNPPERTPWATIGLLAINILVFAVVNKGLGLPDEVAKQYGVSWSNVSPVTMFTSTFLHGDIFHLLGNMWFLYLFGFAVEGRLGWWKYFLLYLVSSFAGDLLHLALLGAGMPNLPSVGASGAIMGVMGMGMYLFAHARVDVFIIWFPWVIGIKEWPLWGVGAWFLFWDLIGATLVMGTGLSGGVGNLAHLGGAAAGFLAMALLRMPRDDEYTSETKKVLAETKDYSMLSASQLKDLTANQPDNIDISLEWVNRIIQSGYKMDPQAVARFAKHLPKLLSDPNVDPARVGFVLMSLGDEWSLSGAGYLDCGVLCEKVGKPQFAKQLYYRVMTSPNSSSSDKESAAFKAGMVMEAWFQDYVGAKDMYDWALVQWPVGAYEGQFKARLEIVRPRAEQQAAAQIAGMPH